MKLSQTLRSTSILIIAAASLTNVARAHEFFYKQTNLVSDGAAQAVTTDMHLKNPWGITAFTGGPFWISDNATGLTTLYDGKGDIVPLTVTIAPPKNTPMGTLATPTGTVFNPNPNAFLVGLKQPAALFIFATEDGTISAWNPTVNLTMTLLEYDDFEQGNGSVYKGLALASNSTGTFLYATNFRHATVDVFDSTFKLTKLKGSFSDPMIPAGYAPFGIALIDGNLFVTYAKQDAAKHDDDSAPGRGFVDVFDTDGNLIRRFASRGALDSPWGIARAPMDFGGFSSDILIGNFGDGRISAFTSSGQFHGLLLDTVGKTISISGLWALRFGDGLAADANKLYFTAGLNKEVDGLFGSLEPVVPIVNP
jgi:uncharacterized protein (TIGR03118 family)